MSDSTSISRPASTEHSTFALTYVDATARALAAAGHDDVVALLDTQVTQLRTMLSESSVTGSFAYAPGKWTLSESLLHVADTERVFSYRLLRIARGDQTPLPGFDQDTWVPNSRAGDRSLDSVLAEIDAVRSATLALVRSLDAEAVSATGTASGATVSVRALVWMVAGHFAHHLDLTRDRYLA